MKDEFRRSFLWIGLPVITALLLLAGLLLLPARAAQARMDGEAPMAGNRQTAGPGHQEVQAPSVTSVFINEIHYDNIGADQDEGAEVAGPAGTDLTNWSLVAYNGNGGGVYDTRGLSQTIPDLENGYGVLFFAIPKLQNGAPDGIALVDNTGNVVQFLSYEGTFVATNGPAAGMTSTDIGISERGAVGTSLQLVGSGHFYENFSWTGPISSTYNAVNTGQTFGTAPDLSIEKTGPTKVFIGQPVAYQITVLNTGIPVASNVVVTDTLPVGTKFDSESSSYPHTHPAPGVYVWQVGDLIAGTQATINLTVTTDLNAADGTIFTNTATTSSDYLNEDKANNTDQVTTTGYQFVPIATARAGTLGEKYAIEGQVTVAPGMYGGPEWELQDASGGISVYAYPPHTLALGDHVQLMGTLGAYNGQEQFTSLDWFNWQGAGAEVTPQTVTAAEVLSGTTEGWLVQVEGSVSGLGSCSGGYNFYVDDGSGLAHIYVDKDTYIDVCAMGAENGSHIIVTGFSTEYRGDYEIKPRMDSDVTLILTAPQISKSAPVLVAPGHPFTYTLTVGNQLGYALNNLVITDRVPVNTSFALALDGGVLDGNVVRWDVASLADQDSADLRFVVTATGTAGSVIENGDYAVTAANFVTPTFGAPVTTIADTAVHIHNIQGEGDVSPLVGVTVQGVDGVVTKVQSNGFFMQDPNPDADPLTSEGIWVYTGSAPAVSVGQEISVTAKVGEYGGVTELTSPVISTEGAGPSISPEVLDLPIPEGTSLEPLEGMLVTIPEQMTASQNYFLGRYGEVTLSADGRLYNPTNGNGLGEDADLNMRRMLVLDDGSSSYDPRPVPYLEADGTLREGDVTSGLVGVIDYGSISSSLSYYKLQPTEPVTFTRVNARTAAPEAVGGNVKVASFNVLNYFTTLGSRGAATAEEFQRQRTKIIAAIKAIDADVVGLMEIENNGDGADSAIQDLVDGLNAATAPGTYAFVSEPSPGTDQIKVAMIYQPASVTPLGAAINYQVTDDPVYTELYDRPPLAQTFRLNANQGVFTVIVNHFKSKGSCPADPSSVDADYGQGCWNAKRVAQAAGLLDFVDQLKADTGDSDVLVIGDLNAYGEEDPIQTLTAGGMLNEVAADVPAPSRYSYTFDGQSGYLDQGLATASLGTQVNDVTIWHINADEPSLLDYTHPDFYHPDPYRASDHDPVILGLNLQSPTSALVLSKNVTPSVDVMPGGTLTYTLSLVNTGAARAEGVLLTDTLPSEVTFGGWVQQDGASQANGVITWSGDLTSTASTDLVFTVTLKADFTLYGETVSNLAEYSSTNAGSGQAQADFIVKKLYTLFLPLIPDE